MSVRLFTSVGCAVKTIPMFKFFAVLKILLDEIFLSLKSSSKISSIKIFLFTLALLFSNSSKVLEASIDSARFIKFIK